jgi:MerR family mercuric resistance operon transcriptional regulator
MQIGDLAEQAGVNVQTVRFYERRKLLPEPPRTHSGYREYGEQELKQLRFIRQAKTLGFTLDEIRDILRSRGRGQCPCTDVIAIAERHLRDVREQIEILEKFEKELTTAVGQWKKAGKQSVEAGAICTLIERTMRDRGASERRARHGKRSRGP